jgi:hypothetical protein
LRHMLMGDVSMEPGNQWHRSRNSFRVQVLP